MYLVKKLLWRSFQTQFRFTILTCACVWLKESSADYWSPTMTAKDPLYQSSMGQLVGLSFMDAKCINHAYCSSKWCQFLYGILTWLLKIFSVGDSGCAKHWDTWKNQNSSLGKGHLWSAHMLSAILDHGHCQKSRKWPSWLYHSRGKGWQGRKRRGSEMGVPREREEESSPTLLWKIRLPMHARGW